MSSAIWGSSQRISWFHCSQGDREIVLIAQMSLWPVMVGKKVCFTEEMKPSTSTACKLTVLCRDTHLVLKKLAKHFRSIICGVVFCVSNVLRNYLHICRSLHWAVLNAGEVVILWRLQSVNASLDSVFSLSVRNRFQRPRLHGIKWQKRLSRSSIAASDNDWSLRRFVLPVALTEGIS